jgi:hypothetical protein
VVAVEENDAIAGQKMKFLNQEQIEQIEIEQALLQYQWKERDSEGELVDYLGKDPIRGVQWIDRGQLMQALLA